MLNYFNIKMIESLFIWSAKNLCLNGFYTKSKQSR